MDRYPPAPRGVGALHDDLECDPAALGQDERCLDGQFVDGRGTDLVSGVDGQFDECRAGEQDGAEHLVVGQPGVGGERQPAGQQQPVRSGERHHGAQQRVFGGPLAHADGVTGRRGPV